MIHLLWQRTRCRLEWIFFIAVFIANAAFLHYNAFRCFNFYDMCFPIDGGWRILSGQRPYVDFILFTGPIHFYLHALFIKIFGVGKTAILAYLVVSHSAVIATVFLFLRKAVPFAMTAVGTLLTMTSFYWPVSHPWHDQTAHVWSILAIGVLLNRMPFKNNKVAFRVGFFAGAMAAFSFMTKTNLGMVYAAFFAAVLLSGNCRRASIFGLGTGFAAAAGAVLVLIGSPQEYFRQIVLFGSAKAQERLPGLLSPHNWLINYYWIFPILVLPNFVFKNRIPKSRIVLFLGVVFAGILSVLTGDMVTTANTALWGIVWGVAAVVIEPGGFQNRAAAVIYRLSRAGLMVFAIFLIAQSVHSGLELKAWTRLDHRTGDYTYPLKTKQLQGWKCIPREGIALDELVEFFNRQVSKDDAVLIITEMQILPALTGIKSYKHVPVISFHKGITPVPGMQLDQVRKAICKDLPDWIVCDFIAVRDIIPYLGLLEVFWGLYEPEKELGFYAVFHKKKMGYFPWKER
ncbi:MAG TPA: glycosyltransferase family 39 protein [Candidatus Omnitrophota bacterium]|nr:glycosyltransferase family 39 protein [Candidatus Omnitrophota bacterium]HPD84600.1 glycosyltransferase family 39 protein [Candidatus Omnitrophota bacterium]HRZ03458.1 glycosyltransferase family 39 protein [Candidatus Omnitrophota bacterium]